MTTTQETLVERLREAEELLTLLVAYDDEASPNGLMDAVDNDRQPYQSTAMAGLITHARAWLPGNSVAERCAAYRAEREQAGLPSSSTAALSPPIDDITGSVAGWKLVSVEPTEEMVAEAWVARQQCPEGSPPGIVFAAAYRAMLSASPDHKGDDR